MGKSKSLGFQIHSALQEINLQNKEKRMIFLTKKMTPIFNQLEKESLKNSNSINYIFSKRSAENIAEKSKTFVNLLKENYNIKMVRDITAQISIDFLDSKKGCSTKTISAYKNMLEKVSIACSSKFNIDSYYTDSVRTHKVVNTYKTNASRTYTNEQIEKIYNFQAADSWR